MQEIKHPTETTYFIAYTNDRICVYGVVKPDQVMSSGQPNLYQTINKNEWLAELQNFYVVFGYQFQDEDLSIESKKLIDNQYGEGTSTVNFAQYNQPQFWYILGDFPDVMGEPELFQVFPN